MTREKKYFSIIVTDIGSGHTQRLRKRMKRLVLRSFSLGLAPALAD